VYQCTHYTHFAIHCSPPCQPCLTYIVTNTTNATEFLQICSLQGCHYGRCGSAGFLSVTARRCQIQRLYSIGDQRTSMEYCWNNTDRKKRCARRKICPIAILSITSPTQTALGLKSIFSSRGNGDEPPEQRDRQTFSCAHWFYFFVYCTRVNYGNYITSSDRIHSFCCLS